MVDFTCKVSSRIFKRCSFQVWTLFFAHFVYEENFGEISAKITEWSIRLESFHFGAGFTNYGVQFCSFWTNFAKIQMIFSMNSEFLNKLKFPSCVTQKFSC